MNFASSLALAIPPLTALIGRINKRETEIRMAGRTMLMLAREQGGDLLTLKDQTPHGDFKGAVEGATIVSYRQAMKYMRIAKLASEGKFDPSLGIDAFLSLYAAEQPAKRKGALAITRDDAEYILKINSLATRGSTEGECSAAQSKLEGLAQQLGTDATTLVDKAEKLCPQQTQSAHAVALRQEVLAPYMKMSKPQLIEAIWDLLNDLAQRD